MDRHRNHRAGDVVGVPLPSCGFGIGLLIRVADDGYLCLAHFLDERFETLPPVGGLVFDARSFIYTARISGLGVHDGTWTVLGPLPNFAETAWPVPDFGHRELLTDRCWRHVYDESAENVIERHPATASAISSLPQDGSAGAGLVEQRLERLLPHARSSN